MTANRLKQWVDQEIAAYEHHYGKLTEEGEARMRDQLEGTLHGAQLRAADEAGTLGDTVLAALKSHSDRLRDTQLARWFRDHR